MIRCSLADITVLLYRSNTAEKKLVTAVFPNSWVKQQTIKKDLLLPLLQVYGWMGLQPQWQRLVREELVEAWNVREAYVISGVVASFYAL